MPDDGITPPGPDALRRLGAWADELARPDFAFGRWTDGGPGWLPWVERLPDGERFLADVGRLGFVIPFDWRRWLEGPDGHAYLDDRSRVASAPPDDLVRLLTTLVRGDRFTEGELLEAFESGLLAAICERARALVGAS